MPLIQNKENVFLQISSQGRFVKFIDGKTTNELFDSIEAKLLKVSVKGENSKYWIFELTDEKYKIYLSIFYSSKVAFSLLKRLTNCNLTLPISIHVYMNNKNHEIISWIKQNGLTIGFDQSLEPPYPRVDMKGDGTKAFDYTNVSLFYEDLIETRITPLLRIIH
jgi:hypothetical protein